MIQERYSARSASDRTDRWPFWYVADRQAGNLNVTERLLDRFAPPAQPGVVFLEPSVAKMLALIANSASIGELKEVPDGLR